MTWTYRTNFFIGYENLDRSIDCDLWQGRARFRLNQRNVRAVDRTIDRNVFEEVRGSHELT